MRSVGLATDFFLSYIENQMNAISHLITNKYNKNDGKISPEEIAEILVNIQYNLDNKYKDMLVSAMFDFVTPEGDVLASTIHGVINPPKKVDPEAREYMRLGKETPWNLHTCKPDRGITVDELIIPLGFGVTDSNNKFIGYVTSGIKVSKFKERLNEVIDSENYKFLVLNQEGECLLSSDNETEINRDTEYKLKYDLQYLQDKKERFSTLDETIFINGTEYIFYTKTDNYPFIILIGINRKDVHDFRDMEIRMLELESEGKYNQLFLLSILYAFQAKIINPVTGQKNYSFDFEIPKVFSKNINDLFLALEQMESFMELKIQKEVAEEITEEKEQLARHREIFFEKILQDLNIPMKSIDSEKLNISKFLEENKDKLSSEAIAELAESINNINSSAKSISELVKRISNECKTEEE